MKFCYAYLVICMVVQKEIMLDDFQVVYLELYKNHEKRLFWGFDGHAANILT